MTTYKNALKGQVALVTGASRGIGRGIALQLGEAGATVYITGRKKSPEQKLEQSSEKYPSLEKTANDVTARGGKGIAVYCDHEDEKQVEGVFERIAKEQNGQLDILVNNAYAGVPTIFGAGNKKFWELPTSMYDTINNTGLRNHYVCAVLAAKLMVPRRKGLIVTVSSFGGAGYLFNVAYGVGKAACDKLASDTAVELRDFNITSVSLWPGAVKTEFVQETANDVTSRGGKGIAVYCDHEDEKQVEGVFERIAKEQNGQLDILVNNAYAAATAIFGALSKKQKFWEMPTSVYDTINNTGLRNHYVCAVLAAKLMVPRRKGLIVTVSSFGGAGYLFNVAYGIGKAACDKLASDTAVELSDFNVTSVSLWPGMVKTEFIQENALNREKDNDKKWLFEAIYESTEFPGKCVVALAADQNKQKVTGRILTTDALGKKYNLKDIDGATINFPPHPPYGEITESLNNIRAPSKT